MHAFGRQTGKKERSFTQLRFTFNSLFKAAFTNELRPLIRSEYARTHVQGMKSQIDT